MGNNLVTCDIHGKAFPENAIDSTKTRMYKLYAEQTQVIEGQKVTLSLFVGSNENEGADSCHACMMEKFLRTLEALGIEVSWKQVKWEEREIQKKDGSGTYKRNFKVVRTAEEIKQDILEAKKAQTVAPPAK